MQSVILGTAQWGLNYGATNEVGRLTNQSIAEITVAASRVGIIALDTAPAYGDAEERIGGMRELSSFQVQTKVRGSDSQGLGFVDSLQASLARLDRAHVSSVLIHDWAEVPPPDRPNVANQLERLRAAGLVDSVGVSAYEEADVSSALDAFQQLDVVQVPVSVLDQRLVGASPVAELRARGARIQARSVFLQGAALSPSNHPIFGGHPDVKRLRSAGDPLALCLGFVRALEWVDDVVLAVTSAAELEQVWGAWSHPLVREEWVSLASDDPWLIDPRQWSKSARAGLLSRDEGDAG